MNNPQLNFDMISKILNIRMETKKEERLHQEALEDWKDDFDYIDTEILSLLSETHWVYRLARDKQPLLNRWKIHRKIIKKFNLPG